MLDPIQAEFCRGKVVQLNKLCPLTALFWAGFVLKRRIRATAHIKPRVVGADLPIVTVIANALWQALVALHAAHLDLAGAGIAAWYSTGATALRSDLVFVSAVAVRSVCSF